MGVVVEVSAKGDRLSVILAVSNQEAFEQLASQIRKLFGKYFSEVHIEQQGAPKQSRNYGSTFNPNNRAPYAKKVIAVTSGKGGVGKTTVSVNLAVALAQEGFRVGLLDADVYGPNVPRMLGLSDERMRWGENDKIIPGENYGIKVMSVALTTPAPDTPLVWRSSVAVSALIQFLEDVDWGSLDFLVIDMPPGTGDIQLTMAQELPIAAGVIVTTPQQVALDDVSRAIVMFQETGVPIGGLIENMSYFIAPDTGTRYDIFGAGGGQKLALRYDIPFLGEIPLTMEIRESSDAGKPPVAVLPQAAIWYRAIAKKLIASLL
ncbi:MAG: Mrp/NBP35 family ATP-binding protein [Campylobacterales bacterium]